jgi:hypothetical protein
LATEPEAIAKSYFIEDRGGERRYYDDCRRQALAMRATATAIRTRREDLGTIRAMLTLAQARGWQAIEVKGSKEFRREAWIEAQALGLEARGHRASDPDRQEALRRRAERGVANRIQAPASSPPSPPSGSAPERDAAFSPERAWEQRSQAAQPTARPAPMREAPAPAGKALSEPVKSERGASGERQAVRRADDTLSPDARLVLRALAEKIDRQIKRHHARSTAELKAFVGDELLRKERAQGPVTLSAEQRRAVTAPAPAQPAPAREAAGSAPAPRLEPQAPPRALSR